MSSLVETVIEFVADYVWGRLVGRWPWLEDAVGAVLLVIGVVVAIMWPSESGDRMQALILCGGTAMFCGALLFYRAWRRQRPAATPAE